MAAYKALPLLRAIVTAKAPAGNDITMPNSTVLYCNIIVETNLYSSEEWHGGRCQQDTRWCFARGPASSAAHSAGRPARDRAASAASRRPRVRQPDRAAHPAR